MSRKAEGGAAGEPHTGLVAQQTPHSLHFLQWCSLHAASPTSFAQPGHLPSSSSSSSLLLSSSLSESLRDRPLTILCGLFSTAMPATGYVH